MPYDCVDLRPGIVLVARIAVSDVVVVYGPQLAVCGLRVAHHRRGGGCGSDLAPTLWGRLSDLLMGHPQHAVARGGERTPVERTRGERVRCYRHSAPGDGEESEHERHCQTPRSQVRGGTSLVE